MEKYWRVAIASRDGKVVNEHFGRAREFYIVDISPDGTGAFFEKRAVAPLCFGSEHTEAAMAERVGALRDCVAVLAARVGMMAGRALEINGISVFEQPDFIENAISKLADYFIKTNFALPEE